LFAETVKAYGAVDILSATPVSASPSSILDYTEADWDRQMGVNVKGVLLLTGRGQAHDPRAAAVQDRQLRLHLGICLVVPPEVAYDTSKALCGR
jgi:NAD(P)-dependent dehydrogenase (short-subunit alcohol dehydrogenase family)